MYEQEIKKPINIDYLNNNSNENNINLLIEIPYLKILPTYAIQDICHLIYTKKYKKNEYVLKQGEQISNIYIVKSGSFISSINYSSISNISYDINSFIHYQNITNEPFLEERKYELDRKMKNNQIISLFIYQRKNFFGDIEIITGKERSLFNIKANEDDSILCYIDKFKWVKLTKRIRIPFTKAAMDKIDRINERLFDILHIKNKNTIDKVKMWKDKINFQIEVNDNYDSCVKRIGKKEKRLKEQLKKYKQKEKDKKLNIKEKSKSLRDFNYHKNYILNLFKYPNILKNETKEYINKYLNKGNKRNEQRLFKLNKTKSLLNINQYINKNNINSSNNNLSLINSNKKIKNPEILKLKSKLFLTNSIKNNKFKNNSMDMIDILNSTSKNPKNNNIPIELKYSGLSRNKNIFTKNNNEFTNNEEYKQFKNFSNLIIKGVFGNKNNLTFENISDNKEYKSNKTVRIKLLTSNRNNSQIYNNKSSYNSLFIADKREKMDIEKINFLLKEKYNFSKNNLIENLLGKKENNLSFNE